MVDYLIRDEELRFLLWDWLDLTDILKQSRFSMHDRESVSAVLDVARKFAETRFLPLYKATDSREPQLDVNGEVHILPEIRTVLREYATLGMFGLGFAEHLGGMNMPMTVGTAVMSQFNAANVSIAAYAALTAGNARVIANFGSNEQVDAFALPQISGEAFGTMCLSEPQAGSALGDIRTRALPDGADALGQRFRVFGNKMWISGGDHNASENIIHLVLAKIPDARGALIDGSKGISLLIVPKVLPNGDRNDIAVAGLNHKMGYRGTSNCLLNFGEGRFAPAGAPGAVGYLIGEVGTGLSTMFNMMNEARINVGVGAAALAYRGYRQSVRYASDRAQGRALGGSGNDMPIPIIQHPDVQRMLLSQKCYAEGALAIVHYCAALADRAHVDPKADELLTLLTPVAKAWSSEFGLAANDLAIQVHGGYGYTRDFDVEQLYRDNRLNPIHEGTTGIQALDLLGRKVLRSDGHALELLGSVIGDTITRTKSSRTLLNHGEALASAWRKLRATILILKRAPEPRALANATDFLRAFGHIVIAWIWLDQARLCETGRALQSPAFVSGKLRACRFFFETEVPKIDLWLEVSASLTDVATATPLEEF